MESGDRTVCAPTCRGRGPCVDPHVDVYLGLLVMARVLFVSSEGVIGGAETSLLLLTRQICARFEVAVACPAPSPLSKALAADGIESHALPQPPRVRCSSPRYAAYWLATVCGLVRAIRLTKPDIVHANTFYAGAASLPATLVTRRRLLLHARDLVDFGILTRLFDRHCNRVIAVSHAVKCALVSRGIAAHRIQVVYNGLDTNGSLHDGPHENAPPPVRKAEDFVFAHVGQFAPWKNHDIFIKAAAVVARDLPQAQFVIVGDDLFERDGAYKRDLGDLVRRSPAADRIHLWGWRTDMEEVWPAVDCLVHTAEREAFGRVIVEAMGHRIAVIAAACGGPAEIIHADRTGVLVPPGNVEALGEAMLRVARDREFAGRIATAGYRHVLSNFTAPQTAARVQEVYEDILSS
jgi:glycosyltransferase involved in cell wall biosynthesis